MLLGTYNGARHLREQLRSFALQSWQDWSLHVSDDGSQDATLQLVDQFSKEVEQDVHVRTGPRSGLARNFMALAADKSLKANFFAFSDQDDVWLPHKLAEAVGWMASVPSNVPALYLSRTELIDDAGALIGRSQLFRRPPSFRNALAQSIGGANTMVFNSAVKRLFETVGHKEFSFHDWNTYQIVTAVGGTVRYDPHPSIRYRQHGANVLGSNRGLRSRLARLRMVWDGKFADWNEINIDLLRTLGHMMPSENLQILDRFAEARRSPLGPRLWNIYRAGVCRQTVQGNFDLYLAAILGRI
ncbi:glycosyltransferase [Bradyrhizobium sp. LHD-71]|uniref:glycosyltransferase n=1 Tax=Bradyrhizobium sp. LHD-71 TaxID=3072141 RepID=UPI00280CB15C|nr:glycosyltransferase [Bradyrhizobium sp. LHD-71]MDQ8728363.1 glycosyltransferase [Bradyrhizobium sp. LHD-71]